MKVLIVALGLGWAVAGCAGDSPVYGGSSVSKAHARRAVAQGKGDGGDLCAQLGWYGDGACDDFCPAPDPDCAREDVELCNVDSDCPTGYCAHFATCLAIGCPPAPPSQCVYPDCGDGSAPVCDAEPQVCADGTVYAVIRGCHACVDPRTCERPA